MTETAERKALFSAADALLALAEKANAGGVLGDANDRYMVGAYLHGTRRFRWIRYLAAEGAAQEANILTRSLASMAVRAAYLTIPSDPKERRRRYLQLHIRYIDDTARLISAAVEHDFETAGIPDMTQDLQTSTRELRSIEQTKPGKRPSALPRDAQLFKEIGLMPFYAGIYMPSSDAVHFSLGAAVDELSGKQQVLLEARDPVRSEIALSNAIVVYGFLIHQSEQSLGHKLGSRCHEVVTELRRSIPPAEVG